VTPRRNPEHRVKLRKDGVLTNFSGETASASPENAFGAMFSVLWMQLFRYSTSIYGGSDVLIGASWDLLKWFVVAGIVGIVLHAAVKAVASRRTDRAQ
jgi:hypothetical protein